MTNEMNDGYGSDKTPNPGPGRAPQGATSVRVTTWKPGRQSRWARFTDGEVESILQAFDCFDAEFGYEERTAGNTQMDHMLAEIKAERERRKNTPD